ncbi:MAG: hypothetical protein DWQ02_24825 [Bacteroidetes bacterium]|nr:MAG: hypothetical protein DWQ02_24825 [Bacteroidota bacterium]
MSRPIFTALFILLFNFLNAQSTILSKANCTGPEGGYYTEIHSTETGYLYFKQTFAYKEDIFRAIVLDTGKSFVLHDDNRVGDELGKEVIFMLKSHDFLRMAMDTGFLFSELKENGVKKIGDENCSFYLAKDPLGHSVELYFSTEKVLKFIRLKNPLNLEEFIEISFSNWQNFSGRTVPQKVEILQAGKDLFTFSFFDIQFDAPGFTKIVPVSKDKFETDKTALLNSNEIQRQAHMENDASLLVSQIADTLVTVQRGNVRTESNTTIKQRFEAYFKTVKYLKWDDISPPVIHISEDGTMATVIVEKITQAKHLDESGNWGEASETTFAWTSTYQKISGQWLIISVTSTRVE